MITLPSDMDSFQAASVANEDATGETAADLFDWDIGW